jgi:hypothetical protein
MGGLDINWFRIEKGHDPNVIRKSLERRYRDPKIVDTIIEMDQEWRKGIFLSIQFATNSMVSRWNGIISVRQSAIRRKPTKKILVSKRYSSKMPINSSRSKSKMVKLYFLRKLIGLLTLSATLFMIPCLSATTKITIRW